MEPHRSGRRNADQWNRTIVNTPVSDGPYISCVRAIQFAPGPVLTGSVRMNVAWSVSARGLNVSLPRHVHPESIELVFYE